MSRQPLFLDDSVLFDVICVIVGSKYAIILLLDHILSLATLDLVHGSLFPCAEPPCCRFLWGAAICFAWVCHPFQLRGSEKDKKETTRAAVLQWCLFTEMTWLYTVISYIYIVYRCTVCMWMCIWIKTIWYICKLCVYSIDRNSYPWLARALHKKRFPRGQNRGEQHKSGKQMVSLLVAVWCSLLFLLLDVFQGSKVKGDQPP